MREGSSGGGPNLIMANGGEGGNPSDASAGIPSGLLRMKD